MRDLCFLKEDTLWISRQVSNNYVQILADRPGQWGQGEVRSKRPASPAMGYGLRVLKSKTKYCLYKPCMGNNIRVLEYVSVIENLDFIFCSNCKYGKTKSRKTNLKNIILKGPFLLNRRVGALQLWIVKYFDLVYEKVEILKKSLYWHPCTRKVA